MTGRVYHIYNRGVNKGEIFFSESDYRRFLNAAIHYKTKRTKFSYEKTNLTRDVENRGEELVEIMAYCLMPNHFHFMVKQLKDGGITSYFRYVSNSYSHYVNLKHGRVGPLFAGRFKNVDVDSDEQLMHLSRYIHLNPVVSGIVSRAEDYKWSSYSNFLGRYDDYLSKPEVVMMHFKAREHYKGFVEDQVMYAKELEKIKHLAVDLE